MENKSVFAKAIEILQRYGWTQGSYFGQATDDTDDPGDGPCCLLGACGRAYGSVGGFEKSPEYYFLARRVPFHTVHGWNDRDNRTLEEVVELLKNTDAEYAYSKTEAGKDTSGRHYC